MQVPFLNKNNEYTPRIACCNMRNPVITFKLTRILMLIPYSVVTAEINCKIQILHWLFTRSANAVLSLSRAAISCSITGQEPRKLSSCYPFRMSFIANKRYITIGCLASLCMWMCKTFPIFVLFGCHFLQYPSDIQFPLVPPGFGRTSSPLTLEVFTHTATQLYLNTFLMGFCGNIVCTAYNII